jgi:hypothetical protein
MIPCFFCKGPWSPTTGHVYLTSVLSCRKCTVDFWKWMENHTNKRQSKRSKGPQTKESFYEAATNSFSTRPMFRRS